MVLAVPQAAALYRASGLVRLPDPEATVAGRRVRSLGLSRHAGHIVGTTRKRVRCRRCSSGAIDPNATDYASQPSRHVPFS